MISITFTIGITDIFQMNKIVSIINVGKFDGGVTLCFTKIIFMCLAFETRMEISLRRTLVLQEFYAAK